MQMFTVRVSYRAEKDIEVEAKDASSAITEACRSVRMNPIHGKIKEMDGGYVLSEPLTNKRGRI